MAAWGMDDYRALTEEDAAGLAEAALKSVSAHFTLSDIERISGDDRRNLVLRARMSQGRAVIVKATRWTGYDDASPSAFADSGLVKEWTARDVLKRRMARPSSPLLAGDAGNGLIVFDDFGMLPSMVSPLMEGTVEAAEASLTAYAVAVAQMHAATHDCVAEHQAALTQHFPNATLPRLAMTDWLDQPMPEIAGQRLPADEFDMIRTRLNAPGPWLALVHADGCPDNVLMDGDQAHLVDFEFSAPGHMLLDAVYWRIGFPSCWCAGTVPEDVADRIEAAYRRELAAIVPEALDDALFHREMAAITVARALFSLCRMLDGAMGEDTVWGTTTRRNRLLWYLQAAIAACDRGDALPGIRGVLARWSRHLSETWPDSTPLPLYPAFA